MTLINRTFIILLVSSVLVVSSSSVLQYLTLKSQTESNLRNSLRNQKVWVSNHFVSGDSLLSREAWSMGFLVRSSGHSCRDSFYRLEGESGERFMVYKTCIKTNGTMLPVEIMENMEASITFRQRLLQIHLYTLFTIALVFISIKLIAFNNIWGQLKKSLELLKRRELHTRKVEFPASSIREIDELNQELNELSVFLNREYHSQKEFIENLSHELFTPISNIRGKLELLIQSENLKETDIKLIAKALEGLDRLIRVNRSLIILTKVENSQRIEKREFSISEVVDQALDLFEDQIRLHGLTLVKKAEDHNRIRANRDLIEILVVNLLRNAIIHNKEDGALEIIIGSHTLQISNTGIPESLEAGRIFKRFSSDSEHSQSVGLGLAISRRICSASDIGIRYTYENGMHRFTLDFSHITV